MTHLRRAGRLAVLIGCLGLAASFLFAIGCRRVSHDKGKPGGKTQTVTSEDVLEAARDALAKRTDLASCRAALRQLNLHLNNNPDQKPSPPSDEERSRLVNEHGLDEDELNELASPTFTSLDAHYLTLCFLLRDAARALEVDGLKPREQAEQAFAWVVRQVRLSEREGAAFPPFYVLRRGWGSSLERSLVFLDLVNQLGLRGGLLSVPQDMAGERPRWLPAVRVDREVFVFDSRLGLPLPGSLAELQERPELLQALSADERFPYDVTAGQLKQAELYLFWPLSALAPRMKFLESLLDAGSRAVLAAEPAAELQKAREFLQGRVRSVQPLSRSGDQRLMLSSPRLFLSPEEGGKAPVFSLLLRDIPGYSRQEGDLQMRLYPEQVFVMQLVPWTALPEQIRDLPSNVELGRLPRSFFQQAFVSFYTDPDQPRELMLHGRYSDATNQLVQKLDQISQQKAELQGVQNLEAAVGAWLDEARKAQAEALAAGQQAANAAEAQAAAQRARNRLEALWKEGGKPVLFLLARAIAEPLGREATYHLALCKHEQAEQLQTRLARPGEKQNAAEAEAARNAWRAASGWWETFLGEHGSAPAAAAARLRQARALAALGQADAAADQLENLSGDLTPLEKTSRLYQARQLRQR